MRLYRVIERNDPAFDLTYDHPDREPVPSLAGVRSYLTDPLWIPVRDFQLEVEDLPPLPDATRAAATTSDTAYTLELPIPVAGGAAFSFRRGGAVADLAREKLSGRPAAFPRGERWKLGPLSDIIEDPVAYDVTVTFGVPPDSMVRPLTLTFNPVVRLVNAAPGGPFEARKDHPLALNIVGGTAPYRADAPVSPPTRRRR